MIIPFENVTIKDVNRVGGKNASLGEMIKTLSSAGVRVPGGFAITVAAYQQFMAHNTLFGLVQDALNHFDPRTLDNLSEVAAKCRNLILTNDFPPGLKKEIITAYHQIALGNAGVSFAVRSSANAEDSATASFAGQHDSFLNVVGEEAILLAVKKCYASLFNDRAIKYRVDNNISHMLIGQSVGIQQMVRADIGCAGVAFTIEPENGNPNLIYITGAWGLGETIVQGAVNTDEFYLFKPALEKGLNGITWRCLGSKQQMMVYDYNGTVLKSTPTYMTDRFVLSDEELTLLGNWCRTIEGHYKQPMDIEWAKDGLTGQLFIVQARPETIHRAGKKIELKEFSIKTTATPIVTGKAVGHKIVSGRVVIVKSLADSWKVKDGDILVADITNPDWNALLKKAVCIVTNKGGRTSHASIIARELGIPAVVGTLHATERLSDGQIVTVVCTSGDTGEVFAGKLEWTEQLVEVDRLSHTNTKPMFILADPQKALQCASYPNEGVGLLRMEFIINSTLQIHPMALVNFNELPEGNEKNQINALTRHYADKKEFFVEKLAESIGLVAAAFYPKEVIVRMSDFKTNEYRKLLGGHLYEPEEENPMLGFRGASRYYNDRYKKGFGLECAAIRMVREQMGLTNVKVMIPFCRTVSEGKKVLETMKEFGLERGKHGLEVYVMAEIPSNILLAEDFADIFDGFSIGSNDLTQLTLGLDRDSAIVSDLFNENNEAILAQIRHLIVTAHEKGVKVGLCGQAPSDNADFAKFLVSCSIDSISFNADALLKGIENIIVAEKLKVSETELTTR
ncbi:MAG TPA: phosphoenolpyruvate synthase [Cyclobacteriaceae bacterium]|nr:phosphoenolpyruvate synthase [Cyclobacteriaceae bacterium]